MYTFSLRGAAGTWSCMGPAPAHVSPAPAELPIGARGIETKRRCITGENGRGEGAESEAECEGDANRKKLDMGEKQARGSGNGETYSQILVPWGRAEKPAQPERPRQCSLRVLGAIGEGKDQLY